MKMLTLDDVQFKLSAATISGQKDWADKHGISPAYVSDVIQRRKEPGKKILDALGLRRAVFYVEES